MNVNEATYGNLALDMNRIDMPEERRRVELHVIEGGRAAVSVRQPRAERSPLRLRLAAVAGLVAIVYAIGLFAFGEIARASTVGSLEYEPITVQAGDTMWAIAADHGVDGISTNDMVGIIMDRNGLQRASLQPGQRLLVPNGSSVY